MYDIRTKRLNFLEVSHVVGDDHGSGWEMARMESTDGSRGGQPGTAAGAQAAGVGTQPEVVTAAAAVVAAPTKIDTAGGDSVGADGKDGKGKGKGKEKGKGKGKKSDATPPAKLIFDKDAIKKRRKNQIGLQKGNLRVRFAVSKLDYKTERMEMGNIRMQPSASQRFTQCVDHDV